MTHPAATAPLTVTHHMLAVDTPGPGFTEITSSIARWLADVAARDGLLTAFIRHTSASLVIQENADPDVQHDLTAALDRLAPEDVAYEHATEGPDDMPAHIKSMHTGTTLAIPVVSGRLALGTWQGIYVAEHRARRHRREIVLQFIGTRAVSS